MKCDIFSFNFAAHTAQEPADAQNMCRGPYEIETNYRRPS
jgi:hypothetical protein